MLELDIDIEDFDFDSPIDKPLSNVSNFRHSSHHNAFGSAASKNKPKISSASKLNRNYFQVEDHFINSEENERGGSFFDKNFNERSVQIFNARKNDFSSSLNSPLFNLSARPPQAPIKNHQQQSIQINGQNLRPIDEIRK